MFSTLFISHGAPNTILYPSKSMDNLKKYSKRLKKPNYIVVVSAHYATSGLKVINYDSNSLIYDFYGFEKRLYEYEYKISSDKDFTFEVINRLKSCGVNVELDLARIGFDHGVWTTLAMLFDRVDVPIIQLSLPLNYSEKELIALGESMQVLKEDALLIFSGGVTHNLMDIEQTFLVKPYAKEFNSVVRDSIEGNGVDILELRKDINYRRNHPSAEHFLPLYMAYGSAKDKRGESINSEFFYSNISMESFVFDEE